MLGEIRCSIGESKRRFSGVSASLSTSRAELHGYESQAKQDKWPREDSSLSCNSPNATMNHYLLSSGGSVLIRHDAP